MTVASPILAPHAVAAAPAPDTLARRLRASGRIVVGGGVLLIMLIACLATLPFTLDRSGTGALKGALYFDRQTPALQRRVPAFRVNGQVTPALWFGADTLGRSLLGRSLLGGSISLLIGFAAAAISVFLGVSVGLVAGYRGGWLDSLLMRSVDILYGLPYILLVVLFKMALEPMFGRAGLSPPVANLVVLFLAIGLVSWLTMARVIRGQVLSLRAQPFVEACKAAGLGEWRIFTRHLLPNLIGPITVYATLIIPIAILEESFLSFLGIGIQPPMPTWGSLASDGLIPALNRIHQYPHMLIVPCALLSVTLLSLNFMGDGLRDVFDPKREAAKV
jgi:oligopeptide transport system permease protein